MYENSSENLIKKWRKIGIIGLFALIIVFILIKVLSGPPSPSQPQSRILPKGITEESPEGVAIKYLLAEQEGKKGEAEKYLFPDFSQIKLFRESYLSIEQIRKVSFKKTGEPPEFKVLSSDINRNKATVNIEEITKGSFFFGFVLPEKVRFRIDLLKTNGKWKIVEIDSSDLVLEKKLGEKIESRKGVFITPLKIGDYLDEKPADKFNKFIIFEVLFENKSLEPVTFSSVTEWRIFNEKNDYYYPIPSLEARTIKQNGTQEKQSLKIPTLPDIKIGPGETKKYNIYFEVPKGFSVKKVIYQNQYKKFIFKIE